MSRLGEADPVPESGERAEILRQKTLFRLGGANTIVRTIKRWEGNMATRSSHPLLSCADGAATGMTDVLLLLGRVLIAVLFLMTVWTGGPAAAYLKSIHYPTPDVMSVLAHIIEWLVVISLVLGIGTRYGALLGFIFVVIAFATAHRYWDFPQAAQTLQYIFLSKDLAIAGGLLLLFVTGGGRYSVDEKLRS
jgi:putative oxidoreductase